MVELLAKVAKTDGFEVGHIGVQARILNVNTGRSRTVHTSTNDNLSMMRARADIKEQTGWSLELFTAQQAAKKQVKASRSRAVTHRINDALAAMGVYETPTVGERGEQMEMPSPVFQERGMRFRLMKIGPDEAYGYVDNIPEGLDDEGNRAQRPENIKRSNFYAEQMLAEPSQWKVSPAPVVLFPNPETGKDYVLDGRRRMTAILISQTIQEFWVATGFPKDVFMVLDKNDPRTVAHTLYIKGYKDTANLGSVVKACWLMDNVSNQDDWSSATLNDEGHLIYLEQHPEVVDSMVWGAPIARANKGAIKAAIVAAHVLISRSCEDKAAVERFFEKFRDQDNLAPGEPVNALVKWFRGQVGKTFKTQGGLTKRKLQLGQIIRAWNLTQEGKVQIEMTYTRPYTVPHPVVLKARPGAVVPPAKFVSNP